MILKYTHLLIVHLLILYNLKRFTIFTGIKEYAEESTSLIYRTSKMNWLDLELYSWCSFTFLKLSFKYAEHLLSIELSINKSSIKESIYRDVHTKTIFLWTIDMDQSCIWHIHIKNIVEVSDIKIFLGKLKFKKWTFIWVIHIANTFEEKYVMGNISMSLL